MSQVPSGIALILLAVLTACRWGGLSSCAVGMAASPPRSTPTGERFVVVGGGVCGVTCCQTLASLIQEAQAGARGAPAGVGAGAHVTLVAAAGLLKGVANVVRLSRHLDSFDIVEQAFDQVAGPHTDVIEGEAVSVDTGAKTLRLRDGRTVPYDKLCICTGARPKIITSNPRVLTLRDTASAQQLRDKLQHARRVLITGNGGIAMELVHEITNCQLVWVVREGHMGNAFFDQDAAQFLAPALASRISPPPNDPRAPLSTRPASPAHHSAGQAAEEGATKETDLKRDAGVC